MIVTCTPFSREESNNHIERTATQGNEGVCSLFTHSQTTDLIVFVSLLACAKQS